MVDSVIEMKKRKDLTFKCKFLILCKLKIDEHALDNSYQPYLKETDYPSDNQNTHFSSSWYNLKLQKMIYLENSVNLDKMVFYICRQFIDLLEGRAHANIFAKGCDD